MLRRSFRSAAVTVHCKEDAYHGVEPKSGVEVLG